jgi:hypothetical protein
MQIQVVANVAKRLEEKRTNGGVVEGQLEIILGLSMYLYPRLHL